MSSMLTGRYFSTHGRLCAEVGEEDEEEDEEEEEEEEEEEDDDDDDDDELSMVEGCCLDVRKKFICSVHCFV